MSSLPSQLRPARLDPAFKQSLRPFLGTILLRRGRVTQERLDAALAEVERSGRRLGDILLERRWLYDSELAQALAEQNELDYVDIAARSVDPKVAARLPRDFAEYFRAVPVRTMSSGAVMVAVADPADLDAEILRIILHADVQLVVGELTAIRQAWRHCP
jgi:type IV pilus assembly protein PilB